MFNDKIIFKNTTFEGVVYFDKKEKKEEEELKADFSYCSFEKHGYFMNRKFKKIDLYGVHIERNLFFLGAEVETVDDKETYRVIKNEFYKQSNSIEAHQYYVKELEKHRKKEKNPLDKFSLFFSYYVSEHGKDWLLGLFWIVILNLFVATLPVFPLSTIKLARSGLSSYIFHFPCQYSYLSILIDILIICFIQFICIIKKLKLLKHIVSICFIGYALFLMCVNPQLLTIFVKLIVPLSTIKNAESYILLLELFMDVINFTLIYHVVSSFRRFSRSR